MTEFPDWDVERGTSGLWHARNGDELVKGEDLLDLRDEILRWQGRNSLYSPRAADPGDFIA
jgi:hypothetical protein